MGRRGPGMPGSARSFPGEYTSPAAGFAASRPLDTAPGCAALALFAEDAAGPDDEYPDGGVYLGGTHHPAVLTRLRFGGLRGGSLLAALDIDFDLSLLRPLPEGLERDFSVHWEVPLAVDETELDAVMAEARQVLGWDG